MNQGESLTRQFAEKYSAGMVEGILRTIRTVKVAALVILGIAMAISYTHQVEYLVKLGAGLAGATLIPISVDALIVVCVKISGTAGMHQSAKRWALLILVFPASVSGTVNFIVGGHLVVRCLFVVAVIMIPAAEFLAAKIRPDFSVIEKMAGEITVKREVSDEERARRSAIARKAAATRKRNAASRYSKRRNVRRTDVQVPEELLPEAPVSPAPWLNR